MKPARGRSGFTLIELLVVIGIITILIAILLPALPAARIQALETVCKSNLRQWGLGIQMYINESKGELPQKGPDGSTPGPNNFGPSGGVIGYDDPSIWFNSIPPYITQKSYYQMLVDDAGTLTNLPHQDVKSIFICPLQDRSGSQTIDIMAGDYFALWGTDSHNVVKNGTGLISNKQFPWACSYVWNSKLTSTILASTNEPSHLKVSAIKYPSETVVMVEKMTTYGEYQDPTVQSYMAGTSGRAGAGDAAHAYNGKINGSGYYSNVGQTKADWRRFTTRHRHGGHVLFADGHVGWYSWLETQFPLSSMPFNANHSDANQQGFLIWSCIGPVN